MPLDRKAAFINLTNYEFVTKEVSLNLRKSYVHRAYG